MQRACALGDILNENLRKSFQMFKALRFIDEKNSFRENELITDVIICFAPVQEQICEMIFRQDSDIRVYYLRYLAEICLTKGFIARTAKKKMTRGFIVDTTGTYGTWTVEFVVKPVVTEVRKINSDLSQKFHSMFVAVAAEAGFGAYLVIDIIFEFLDRCIIFDIIV